MESNVEGEAPDVGPGGGVHAPVGEDAGIDAAGEVLQAEDGLLSLVRELLEHLVGDRWSLGQLPQAGGQGDEVVLCSVVQVTLDPAPLLVLGRHETLPRLLELDGTCLQLLDAGCDLVHEPAIDVREARLAGDGVEQLEVADRERLTAALADREQAPRAGIG